MTDCHRLKLTAGDGKQYLTDVVNAETLLRLVQSVPSPKDEPIKLWLAKVGYERMQEMSDPARALDRACETRNKLTDYWADHAVKKGDEFAILTNIIHQEWSRRQIAESADANGLSENKVAEKTGSGIAKKARLELEEKTGRKVITPENYLSPSRAKKKLK